ncbi:Glycine receptor subunit alpha-2 [Durusdinium trenchii]|uniref:Glycine receptor subunit alpha-2 n=1 Tax=Durusdinium trenchii TaxID=1381693 RepID=A0ABP0IMW6_9DINO
MFPAEDVAPHVAHVFDTRSQGYAMIGPPLDYGWALYMFNAANLRAKAASSAGKPKLLLVGTNDQFCSMQSFKGFADSVPGPKEMQVLNGSDHFNLFQSLPQALAEWVQRAFGVNMPDFARGAWLGQAEQRNSTPQAAQAAQASPQAPERPQGSPGRRPSGSPKKDKSPR